MFFFIAGIQPRTIDLGEQPRMCPACGLARAKRKRVDHYLSLFFLPLLPVKKGAPFLACEACGRTFPDQQGGGYPGALSKPRTCPNCGGVIETDFRFCPFCGRAL